MIPGFLSFWGRRLVALSYLARAFLSGFSGPALTLSRWLFDLRRSLF